jgi:predicted metal-dependent HD superfamily phosphohydrolase
MSILGSDWPDYLAYAEGVYREYLPVYGHDAYAAGRVALFLQPTLTRDAIFLMAEFAERETAARENLHREIALWQAGGFAPV